jgi:hypothetical protein
MNGISPAQITNLMSAGCTIGDDEILCRSRKM